MKLTDLIKELADEIAEKGDYTLSNNFIIRENYGKLEILK
jgi:hypothetical protein